MENKETFFARVQPYLAPEQVLDVKLAYTLAKFGHRFQKRKEIDSNGNNIRYFEHCRRVAIVLMDELQIHSKEMVIAAICHDLVEDSDDINQEMLEHCFGHDIVSIIKSLSKVPKEGYLQRLNNCQDWRVLMIKSCDRLDNLRSLMVDGVSKEFMVKQINETKNDFYPLLDKLISIAPQAYFKNVLYVRDEIRKITETYLFMESIKEKPCSKPEL